MNNFFLIILDGVGIGELPDAANYGDVGSDTLCNIARALGGLNLPKLEKMGLGNIKPIKGINPQKKPLASFGKLKEVSKGKDSITGHWELGGLYVDTDFSYFPDGFPESLMKDFLFKTGLKGYLGNKAASGTEIIKELGEEHITTGFPIVYTSADSVFQIAAHEDIIPLNPVLNRKSFIKLSGKPSGKYEKSVSTYKPPNSQCPVIESLPFDTSFNLPNEANGLF
jgi:phosphopentomutase